MPGTRSKTRNWLKRHARDAGVRKAQRDGYRSRAAYKLLELDESQHLLSGASRVVDLGAAPGSWSQVVRAQCPSARVVALDLVEIKRLEGITIIQADFTSPQVRKDILEALGGFPDLLLCDAAPDISGVALRDHGLFEQLHDAVLDFCEDRAPNQAVVKSYTGDAADYMSAELKQRYRKVLIKRPKATKSSSKECYLLGKDPL